MLPTCLSVRSPWKVPSSLSYWLRAHVQVELALWSQPQSIVQSAGMLLKRQLYVGFNDQIISLDTKMFSDYGHCDIPRDRYRILHRKCDTWYGVLSERKGKKRNFPLLFRGEWSFTHNKHSDGLIKNSRAKPGQAFQHGKNIRKNEAEQLRTSSHAQVHRTPILSHRTRLCNERKSVRYFTQLPQLDSVAHKWRKKDLTNSKWHGKSVCVQFIHRWQSAMETRAQQGSSMPWKMFFGSLAVIRGVFLRWFWKSY